MVTLRKRVRKFVKPLAILRASMKHIISGKYWDPGESWGDPYKDQAVCVFGAIEKFSSTIESGETALDLIPDRDQRRMGSCQIRHSSGLRILRDAIAKAEKTA